MAAPALRKVLPLTSKGRSEVEETTGGAGPPRAPAKLWTLTVPVGVALSFALSFALSLPVLSSTIWQAGKGLVVRNR